MGWESVGEPVAADKCIYLMAPHTSIWDFAIGFFYYRSLGGHLHVMIKKEAFFFPVKFILRSMGGFPIDRGTPSKTILSVVHQMKKCEASGRKFHLVICPEGTRKAVSRWKTGYHTIARATGADVYLTFIDFGRKRVGILTGEPVPLTDDARADTDRIQSLYEPYGFEGKHPGCFLTR